MKQSQKKSFAALMAIGLLCVMLMLTTSARAGGLPEITPADTAYVFQAFIQWNDNNDESGLRPDFDEIAADLMSNFSLVYQYEFPEYTESFHGGSLDSDTDGSYLQMNNLLGIGVNEYNAISCTIQTDPESPLNRWIFTATGLPGAVNIFDGAETTTRPVDYFLTQTKPFEQYITEITEHNTGDIFTNTVQQDWSAAIQWLDDSNAYGTRPSTGAVAQQTAGTVYRFIPSGSPEQVSDVTPVINAAEDGTNQYSVALPSIPAYDPNGQPYTYYITPYSASTNTNAGTYAAKYTNIGNNASADDALYKGGTAQYTLTNITDFVVQKEWVDDGNAGGTRPEEGKVKLRLYSATISMGEGAPVIAGISEPSPVQGFDSIDVPSLSADVNTCELSFTATNKLPMYDAEGYKYLYIALETGLTGDYRYIVDNAGAVGNVGQEVADAVNGVTVAVLSLDGSTVTTPKYVLHGGTLTNKLSAAIRVPAAKEFKAQAMQSMSDGLTAALRLQYLTDENEWQDVPETSALLLQGAAAVTFDDFSAEQMTLTADGPFVNKYDDEGRPVAYRWVETSVAAQNSDGENVSAVLSGGSWAKEADADVYVYSNALRLEDAAPGVDDSHTTAYFQPTLTVSETGSVVTNRLFGVTQVYALKTWAWTDDNGIPQTAPPDGTTVTLRLRRVDDNRSSGITLADAAGQPVHDITLDGTADAGGEMAPWVALWPGLVRYDDNGKEYTYEVSEVNISTPDGLPWHTELIYNKSVAAAGGDNITQLTANISNTRGPGSGLEFDVSKQWLDGGDVVTRKPVVVGLYNKNDQPVTNNGQNVTATLNAANNWRATIRVPKATETDTVNDYIVKEVSVGGIAPVYSVTGFDGIYSRATATDFDTTYQYASSIGTVGNVNDADGLGYVYNLYIQRVDAPASGDAHAVWRISNQRTGVMTITVTKEWVAGGDKPPVTFRLTRSDRPDSALTEITIAGEQENSASITNQPKYDTYGDAYAYTLQETKIGGVDIVDGAATLPDGNRYVAAMELTSQTITGMPGHHTGDEYHYLATNTRADSYPLTARKLWRDTGSHNILTARPDISFNVYRVPANLVNDESDLAAQLHALRGPATLYASNKIWNTQVNDWYWLCDLGDVQRYDDQGYPYIYFLVENMSGNAGNYQTAYYNKTYESGSAWRPNGAAGTSQDTFGVTLADMRASCGDVLILADGVHNGGGYGDYYSGTVMNYRQEKRTISFNKIWGMPAGWPNVSALMPAVDVALYRTTEKISENQTIKISEIGAYITQHQLQPISEATVSTANYFNYTFTDLDRFDEWGNLFYYYIYEPDAPPAFDAVFNVNTFNITNTYTPGDSAAVEIPVSATWTNNVNGIDVDGYTEVPLGLLPVEFKLFARLQTGTEGNYTLVPGNAILMNTMTLEPPSAVGYQQSVDAQGAFQYMTGFDGQRLPYYGPNGCPLAYWVEEVYLSVGSNGYTTTHPDSGFSAGDPVILSNAGDPQEYTNDPLTYNVTYQGGSASASFTKTWNDSNAYIDNSGYRPARVEFNIWRRAGAGEGEKAYYTDGTAVTVTLPDNNAWTKTIGQTGATIDESEHILPRYAPGGQAYTYYVHSEMLQDADGYADPVATALYTNNIGITGAPPNSIANTLSTVTLTAKKEWNNSITTGALLTWQDFSRLRDLGVLHHAIGFVVQRKAPDALDWEYMPAKTDGTGNVITIEGNQYVGRRYSLQNMTEAQFNALRNTGVSFAMLPQYLPNRLDDSNDPIEYEYNIAEVLWTDSVSYVSISPSAASGTHDIPFGLPDDRLMVGSTSINVIGKIYTYTNTLSLSGVNLIKEWDDNDNGDDTRPDEVTFSVTRIGSNNRFTIALDKQDYLVGTTPDHNKWAASFYLPSLAEDTQIDYSDLFAVNELNRADGYTLKEDASGWSDIFDTYTINNKYDTSAGRKTIDLTATKSYAGDTGWADVTRPDVALSLEYYDIEETGADKWKPITGDNADEFVQYPSAYQPTKTPSADNTVKWEGMYRFWRAGKDGEAQPIQYRVVESMPQNAPYTGDAPREFVLDTNTGVASATVTNTLTGADMGITLAKQWEYGDGGAISDITDLISAGALPEKLVFALQYSTDAGASWADAPGGMTTQTMAALTNPQSAQWQPGLLPVYDKEGKVIQYRVVETGAIFTGSDDVITAGDLGNITLSVSEAFTLEADAPALTFTNAFTHTLTSVSKTWTNTDDTETRPTEANIQLYRDGAAYGDPVTLDADGNWEHEWLLLPLYKNIKENGEPVASVYTVRELDANNLPVEDGKAWGSYDVTYGGTAADGFTITNTYDPNSFTISATKQWSRGTAEVTFTLQATIIAEPAESDWQSADQVITLANDASAKTLNGIDDEWVAVWRAPTKDADGHVVYYRVVEDAPPADYIVSYSREDAICYFDKDMAGNVDVTITNTLQTTQWDVSLDLDMDEDDKPAVQSVAVQLQRRQDGGVWENVQDAESTAELSETNQWRHTFTDLLLHYEYRVVGVSVARADGDYPVTSNDGEDGVSELGSAGPYVYAAGLSQGETRVTLTFERGSLTVSKAWVGGGSHPEQAVVQLWRNDAQLGADVALSAENGWAQTWDKLPVRDDAGDKIAYAVKESAGLSRYDVLIAPESATLEDAQGTGDHTANVTVTNTIVPGTVTLTASVQWNDNGNPYGLRPTSVKLTLWATTDPTALTDPGNAIWKTPAQVVGYTGDATQTLTSEGGLETASWTVPDYTAEDLQPVYYRVTVEDPTAGYAASASPVFTVGGDAALTIINDLQETAWNAALALNMAQPFADNIASAAVQLQYRQDDDAAWEDIPTDAGRAALTNAEGWTHLFDHLPPQYQYRAVMTSLQDDTGAHDTTAQDGEDGVSQSGLAGSYEYTAMPADGGFGTLLAVAYAPTGSLTIDKVWVGEHAHPDSVDVALWRSDGENSEALGEAVTLSDENDWAYTWTDLAVYQDDGEAFTYSVREATDLSARYTVSMEPESAALEAGDDPFTFAAAITVTNTYTYTPPEPTEPPAPPATSRPTEPPQPPATPRPTVPPGPTAPPPTDGGIRITKTVAGQNADMALRFHFTLTLSDSGITGTYGDITFEQGVAHFSLCHGEVLAAEGLPAGVAYLVEEQATEGYIARASNAAGAIAAGITRTAQFTNEALAPTPPTGDDTSPLALLALLALCAGGALAVVLTRGRRSRKRT